AKTAGMLSIPRDLWAVIPGFSPNKINTAHYFGDLYSIPGGGPELAMRSVDPLGADTNPKNLKPGVQVLPGAVALAYARERHAEGGDFGRAERQQQVILGIRTRI